MFVACTVILCTVLYCTVVLCSAPPPFELLMQSMMSNKLPHTALPSSRPAAPVRNCKYDIYNVMLINVVSHLKCLMSFSNKQLFTK